MAAEKQTAESRLNRRRRRSLRRALYGLIRTRLSTGLVTILPIVITGWLALLIFGLVKGTSQQVVEWYLLSDAGSGLLQAWDFDFERFEQIKANRQELGMPIDGQVLLPLLPLYVQWTIPIVAILLTLIVLYVIGFVSAHYVGRRFVETGESFVDRVPLIKTIYRGIKQVLGAFSGEQAEKFQRVALVPFPTKEMRAVGFVTAIFNDSVTGDELATVFIPTTPNPTTGFFQVLRRRDMTELDWNVEDAVRTIMSAGILRPDFLTIVSTDEMKNQPQAAQVVHAERLPAFDAPNPAEQDDQPAAP